MKAAVAYLMLPVTGLIAFLTGREARTRFHGLQSILLGLLWPIGLYAAARGPAVAVQVTFVGGMVIWLVFMVLTLLGRDPRVPFVSRLFERLVESSIRDVRRNTSGM